MGKAHAGKRRVRRLALAGILWAVLLLVAPVLASMALTGSGDRGRLPPIAGASSKSRIDPRLSHVAEVLAGREAHVRCWSSRDWAKRQREWAERWPELGPLGPWRAYVWGDPPAINLPPAICAELTKLARGHAPVASDDWPDALAWSAAALGHESVHVSGILDEPTAECYGMQLISTVATGLGRTTEEGHYLAALYWKHWYPWDPPYYRSRECRNGRRLDLHPDNDVWP